MFPEVKCYLCCHYQLARLNCVCVCVCTYGYFSSSFLPHFFPSPVSSHIACTFLSRFRQQSVCITSPGGFINSYVSECSCTARLPAVHLSVCCIHYVRVNSVWGCLQDFCLRLACPETFLPKLDLTILNCSVLQPWVNCMAECSDGAYVRRVLHVRERIPLGHQLPGYWWNLQLLSVFLCLCAPLRLFQLIPCWHKRAVYTTVSIGFIGLGSLIHSIPIGTGRSIGKSLQR